MATAVKQKIVSGFCGIGSHEGTSPKSRSGKPMKVCVAWQMCACSCHKRLTDMFESVNQERIPIQNPAYVPYTSNIMQFLDDYRAEKTAALLAGNGRLAAEPEKPVEGFPALAQSGKTFTPTTRGRASGQLEDEIRRVCNGYLMGEYGDQVCTPKFVQSRIEPTPSIGAIGQAFTSWNRIGFAIIKQGPVRFVSFTAEGMTKGLAVMKAEHRARK